MSYERIISISGETQQDADEKAESVMECLNFFSQIQLTPFELANYIKDLNEQIAELKAHKQ